jgi:FkbM family methyltransferase
MREIIKRAVRRITGRLGFQIVHNGTASENLLRFHLPEIFTLNRIDAVIDVGASRGQYIDFLRHDVGYAGPIYAFEPLPDNLAVLRRRFLGDGSITIFPYALGASSGTIRMNQMADNVFSSILQPTHASVTRFADQNVVTHELDVEMRTLDELVGTGELPVGGRWVYLKLDTQGYDLEVLKGAGAVLSLVRALQTEASFLQIYEGMPGFLDTFATLRGLGFTPCGVFPVSHDESFHLIEADCVFSRG